MKKAKKKAEDENGLSFLEKLNRQCEPKLLEYKPTLGREVRKQCIKYPGSMVIELRKLGRKVVGVINRTDQSLTDDGYPFKYYADIYLDDLHVFSIEECRLGRWKLESVLREACRALIMTATHNMRNRQNRAMKKGGEA